VGRFLLAAAILAESTGPMIPSEIKIHHRLKKVEEENDVQILFAIESGSRAWGFASPNSDYDIRFIYRHRPQWYQSLYLEDQRNVIECKITDEIDMNGWDIRKALKLFGSSNPSFIEWIQSDIVYVDDGYLLAAARDLVDDVYSPTSGYHHYKSMALANLRNYLDADKVKLKKYLYVIRALLARKYVAQHATPPPLPIRSLLFLLDDEPNIKQEVIKLIERKSSAEELRLGDHIAELDAFIKVEIFKNYEIKPSVKNKDAKRLLNELYVSIIT